MKKTMQKWFLFTGITSVFASTALMSVNAFAQPRSPEFSAFTHANKLHVTILADSCNSLSGNLVINDNCASEKELSALLPVCGATLHVASTRMACPDMRNIPRVVTINLDETTLRTQSDVLVLTYGSTSIPVKINR